MSTEYMLFWGLFSLAALGVNIAVLLVLNNIAEALFVIAKKAQESQQ